MTEQVRVPGHAVPPVPAGATLTQHSREGLPPQNLQPGFTPPPAPDTTQHQQAQQTQQPAPAPTGVDPTIAALLAALSGQPAQTQAQPDNQAPVYQPTNTGGDPLVSSLTGLLAGSGVDVSRALDNAREYGDVNLIDREYLKQVGGKNAAYLIQVAESLIQHDVRTEAAAVQAAHAIAGSAANWNSAVGMFKQSAPAHMQEVVRVMADSNNPAQVEAATKLVVEFARANGGAVVQAGLVQSQAGMGAQQALSKEQFQAELQKLDRNSRDYAQRRGELFGRRGMGKNMGR